MTGSVVLVRNQHHQGTWNLENRLSVSRVVGDSLTIMPDGSWRALESADLEVFGGALSSEPTLGARISVFSVPERLRRRFWTLQLEQLVEQNLPSVAKEFSDFRDDVVSYLRFIGADLGSSVDVRIVASLPNRLTTRVGDDDASVGLKVADDAETFFLINFGDQVRSTLFLSHDQGEPRVLRFAMMPGEGCWFSALHVAFDGCTLDMDEPDFIVELRANHTPR